MSITRKVVLCSKTKNVPVQDWSQELRRKPIEFITLKLTAVYVADECPHLSLEIETCS